MIVAKDRAKQFETELKELLKKWNTQIELEEVGKMWGSESIMKCYLVSTWKDGECIEEFTEINLGTYISF